MKAQKASEYESQYTPTMEFVYDTSKFVEAVLTAEGKLHLRMVVSSEPMFAQNFREGLAGEVGEGDAEDILGKASFEINRQIAIRLLVR